MLAAGLASELAEFCSGQLAVFKIPKRFELVASFPLVGINKDVGVNTLQELIAQAKKDPVKKPAPAPAKKK